jgi:ActR/RegA family two-component response regulator
MKAECGFGSYAMRTLIVDDDALFRRCLQKVLDGETRTAGTIDSGLHEAHAWRPSLIVLDGCFAADCHAGVRALPAFRRAAPSAQIVVLTGLYNDVDERRAMDAGAFSYLEKGDLVALRAVLLVAWRRARSLVPSGSLH